MCHFRFGQIQTISNLSKLVEKSTIFLKYHISADFIYRALTGAFQSSDAYTSLYMRICIMFHTLSVQKHVPL
jgi:hypothetical protein